MNSRRFTHALPSPEGSIVAAQLGVMEGGPAAIKARAAEVRNELKSGKARSEHIPSGTPKADIIDALWHSPPAQALQ